MSDTNSVSYTTLNRFKTIALLEGISFILLVFVAMPLKYFADLPLAVKYTGWAHGVLFVAYVIFLIQCWIEYSWTFKRVIIFFLASLLPFAPFLVDRKLNQETPQA